jgi:hypothetical protein
MLPGGNIQIIYGIYEICIQLRIYTQRTLLFIILFLYIIYNVKFKP